MHRIARGQISADGDIEDADALAAAYAQRTDTSGLASSRRALLRCDGQQPMTFGCGQNLGPSLIDPHGPIETTRVLVPGSAYGDQRPTLRIAKSIRNPLVRRGNPVNPVREPRKHAITVWYQGVADADGAACSARY